MLIASVSSCLSTLKLQAPVGIIISPELCCVLARIDWLISFIFYYLTHSSEVTCCWLHNACRPCSRNGVIFNKMQVTFFLSAPQLIKCQIDGSKCVLYVLVKWFVGPCNGKTRTTLAVDLGVFLNHFLQRSKKIMNQHSFEINY